MKLFFLSILLFYVFSGHSKVVEKWIITQNDSTFIIQAGDLQRIIQTEGASIKTTSLKIGCHEIITDPASDIALSLSLASPNEQPRRVKEPDESQVVQSTATFGQTDALKINEPLFSFDSGVHWIDQA